MNWQTVTLVDSKMIATDIKSLTFSSSPQISFKPGQHFDVRLTAENGYQAKRSYSALNAPNSQGLIELGVQLLDNGEVSPFLYALKPGEQIEIKGPIGNHFIWDHNMPGPLVLIAGGSGMVPLLSMYQHFKNQSDSRSVLFFVSAHSLDKIINFQELKSILKPRITSIEGHVDVEFFRPISTLNMPNIYICGPTNFVESAANILTQELGINPHLIRTERFG